LKLEDFHPYPTMVDIYRSVPAIPAEVLFLTAPKINLPGFRWAPSTFLELTRRWFIYPDQKSARLTPRGLEMTKDCIFLSGDVKIEKGNMYFVSQSTGDSNSEFAFQRSNSSRAGSQTKRFKNPAIIIERSGSGFMGSSSGVLVSALSSSLVHKSTSFTTPARHRIEGDEKVTSIESGEKKEAIIEDNKEEEEKIVEGNEQEEIIYCTFEMHLIVFPVSESTKPEIDRRRSWRGSKSIDLSGEFCRSAKFCVD
jgi:hypothetical protein